MKHKDAWYQRRLAKYFDERFFAIEDIVEFYPDPAVNIWLFKHPGFNIMIKLTCNDDGVVTKDLYGKGDKNL